MAQNSDGITPGKGSPRLGQHKETISSHSIVVLAQIRNELNFDNRRGNISEYIKPAP